MPGSRAEEILALFEKVLDEAPEERQAEIERLAAGDEGIRRALADLLAVDARGGELLDEPVLPRSGAAAPAGEVTEPLPLPGASAAPGASIGPYRLLRRIGQGGMGEAFLALRHDGSYERRVVIKLVRRGMESEESLRRLRVERQILAGLDHPSIARLYDGGTTEEGLPYFVMEYIEGVPIDEHCDQNRLGVEERLELFRRTCSAVHYAHQNLVVHRDLKPSNILVTAAGEPKLLDFGIAKLVNPELASAEADPTLAWHRMLTPSYASPEQVRGGLITTASDVYSLGVILYQLLTGRLPHRLPGRSPAEIEKVLTREDPERPSTAVGRSVDEGPPPEELARSRGSSSRELGRRLAGDLDAIVLKALRPSPRERYGSVEQLTADLERYRDGEPVAARQGGWRYRGRKFLGRHRLAVSLAAAAALAVVAALALVLWTLGTVERERDEARRERDKARTVMGLLTRLFQEQDPYVSPDALEGLTVLETLERSLPALSRQLAGEPLVEAELKQAAGLIYYHRGRWQEAAALVEEAVEVRARLLGEGDPELAKGRSLLGTIRLAQGELEAAEALARQGLEALERSAGTDPREVQDALDRLVTILCYRGDYREALPLAERALSLARREGAENLDLASALVNLGTVKLNLGDYAGAAARYRESIALRGRLLGPRHPLLASPLINLGLALRRLERASEAREAYGEALAIQERALGEGHPETFATLFNLARLAASEGEAAEALELYNRALRILEATGAGDRPNALLVALRRDELQLALGRAELAEELLREHLELWRPRLGPEHWMIALGESILGGALTARGRDREAESLLRGAFEKIRGHNKYRHKREVLDRLTAFLEARGRGEEALRWEAMLVPVDSG